MSSRHEIKRNCPFCNDSKKHLYINTTKGVYYCQKCNSAGPVSKLGENTIAHSDLVKKVKSKKEKKKEDFRLLTPADKIFWKYAEKRRALKFRSSLFLSSSSPGYLIIRLPLRSKTKTFSFGRKVLLSGPRYLYLQNTKGVIATSFKGKVDEAVIVEGFFDLCPVSEKYHTVALMGKQFDEEKVDKIVASIKKKVYIALDPDALPEAILLSSALENRGLETQIIHTTVFGDPGEDCSWIEIQMENPSPQEKLAEQAKKTLKHIHQHTKNCGRRE